MANKENIFTSTFDDAKNDASGALQGLEVALQDNICMEQTRTTGGSKMLADFVAPYSATVVEKLQNAGAKIMGKTNLRELGVGTADSAFGNPENPSNPEMPILGAAVGAAAALSLKLCQVAVVGDTAGDARLSAASCNLVGFKPSYGRISRWGVLAYAGSMDQVAVMANSVKTAAQVAQALSGIDSRDNTTLDEDVPAYDSLMGQSVEDFSVAVPANYSEIAQNSDDFAKLVVELQKSGVKIVELELPELDMVENTFKVIASCEATSNYSRSDGLYYTHKSAEARTLVEKYAKSRNEGFGEEVKKQILLGNYYLTGTAYQEFYLQALKQRTVIAQAYNKALENCDVLLCPTLVDKNAGLEDFALTAGVNLAGLAALNVTHQGFNSQIIALPNAEPKLFQFAAFIEGLS